MSTRSNSERPAKPRKDFPLFAHQCGQWAKKIHGKLHYFGVWDQPDEAEAAFRRHMAEVSGDGKGDAVSVRHLCNYFLDTKETLVEQGELQRETFEQYKDVAKRLVSFFGPARKVETLRSKDFEGLRKSLPKTWSVVTIDNFIIRSKAFFNFAYNEELIEIPVRTGTLFKRASQKRLRIEKATRAKRFFTAKEINQLIDKAKPYMKAMILCGVNLGYGNLDCANLTHEMLDLEDRWIVQQRSKTGVMRIGYLWSETVEAIKELDNHPRKRTKETAGRVFVTKYGNAYSRPNKDDAIAQEFAKLAKACGVYREGVGFYALRHVTQTIGEGSGDAAAVRVLMGHVDNSISATYREHFDRNRVKTVSEHIRQWFLEGSSK